MPPFAESWGSCSFPNECHASPVPLPEFDMSFPCIAWEMAYYLFVRKNVLSGKAKVILMEESPIIIIAIIAAIVGAIAAVVVVLGTLGLLGNLGFLA